MLEKFSSQYYIGRMYIEPQREQDAEYGHIGQAAYDAIRDAIYGGTLTEPPLVMKVDNKHILLKPSDDVPQDTVQIAQETIDDSSITNPPSLEEVFFPTKEAIKQFHDFGFIQD